MMRIKFIIWSSIEQVENIKKIFWLPRRNRQSVLYVDARCGKQRLWSTTGNIQFCPFNWNALLRERERKILVLPFDSVHGRLSIKLNGIDDAECGVTSISSWSFYVMADDQLIFYYCGGCYLNFDFNCDFEG